MKRKNKNKTKQIPAMRMLDVCFPQLCLVCMRELLMQHPQGLVAADQMPNNKRSKKNLYIRPQTEVRRKDCNKESKQNKAYQTHISNALFQNIFFIVYLRFLS